MGASFAAYAGKQLKKEQLTNNWFFTYLLAFLALVVLPMQSFFYSTFPEWSSFFYFTDRSEVPAMLSSVMLLLNSASAIVGFYVAGKYFQKEKADHVTAHSLWQVAFLLYFGIIGFAYKRFMYCGTAREWVNDIPYPVMDFLNSRMFYGYAYFAVPQVVGVLYPAVYWPSTDPTLAIGEKEKEKLDMRTLAIYGGGVLVSFALYIVFAGVCGEEIREGLVGPRFGIFAPVVAFVIAQLVGALLTMWPVFDVPLAKTRSGSKKALNMRKAKSG